jgi:hypothetical protein
MSRSFYQHLFLFSSTIGELDEISFSSGQIPGAVKSNFLIEFAKEGNA